MIDEAILEERIAIGKLIGVGIVSPKVVSPTGFTGTYAFPYGQAREEIVDPTALAIFDELAAMQIASRLITGKFFFATINIGDTGTGWGIKAETYYNELSVAHEYRDKEINPKFIKLLIRFHEWMIK